MNSRLPLYSLFLALAINVWSPAKSSGADPYPVTYTQGNLFYYSSAGSTQIQPTTGIYYGFTATENTTATSISVNVNSAAESALVYGLKADDGTGKPTGAFLASGTTINPVSGWNTITFAGYNLVAGTVYHVVALPTTSGTIPLRHLSGVPPTTFQPYGIVDPNFKRGSINAAGTPGTPANTTAGVFAVGTTTRAFGQPYSAAANSAVSNTAPIAQRFQFTPNASDETALKSFTFRLSTGATPKDIVVSLLDDNKIVLATGILSASAMTVSTTQDYSITFLDAPILTKNSFYNVALNSTASGSTVQWIGTTSQSTDAMINSATFQGVDGYTFNYSNTSFAAVQGQNYGKDFNFSYTTAIPEPATIVSTLIGLGCIMAIRRKIAR